MYRRTTISLGVAAIASWIGYFASVEHAENDHASHTPFYGALAFIALGLSFAALLLFVGGGIMERLNRRTVAPAETGPEPVVASIGDIDTAPTVPVTIRALVPRPRSQVYQCGPAPQPVAMTRAEPMTVEMRPAGYVQMVPVKTVDELIAEVREDLQEARKAAHDRVWLEAVGEVSDTVLQLNDGAPEPPAGSPPVAGQGVDPEAIEMMRRLDRRLRGE